MKLRDLDLSSKDIRDIADKVLSHKETLIGNKNNTTGTKIEIRGHELDERLGKDLIITIYFDRAPMSYPMTVRFFWGYECGVDIIGLDDDKQRLPHKELHGLVVEGIELYIKRRNDHPYGMVDIDHFSGDY